jgi:plasmid stabilization system protein ParE
MKIRWRKEVYTELEAAAQFYCDRNRAAMERFLNEFGNTLRHIQINPEMGSHYDAGARRRRIFGFPFDLIYMLHGGAIVLLALAHHSRRPGYWQDRLI